MSYNVIAIPHFRRALKKLAKKFPSIKSDLTTMISSLEQEPAQGKALGNHCYKIRLAIASKGKGKSGGARVITYIQVSQTAVYLLSIYDKSDHDSLPDRELLALLKHIPK